MKIYAIIKTQFEGIHSYPEASGEEEYLKYSHRHMFHVEVRIEQFHDNRDIEYIAFKRWTNGILNHIDTNLGFWSCERIAGSLLTRFHLRYPGRKITVAVLEDNENGAEVSL